MTWQLRKTRITQKDNKKYPRRENGWCMKDNQTILWKKCKRPQKQIASFMNITMRQEVFFLLQLFVYLKEPIAVTTPANVCSGGHQREVTRHSGQQTRSVCQMLLWLLSSSPCSLFVASSFHILTKQGARGAPHHQHFRSHGPAGVTCGLCHFFLFYAFCLGLRRGKGKVSITMNVYVNWNLNTSTWIYKFTSELNLSFPVSLLLALTGCWCGESLPLLVQAENWLRLVSPPPTSAPSRGENRSVVLRAAAATDDSRIERA